MKSFLIWVSIISGLIAAGLWFWASSRTNVYIDPKKPDPRAEVMVERNGRDWEPLLSAELQSKWNAWAALAAGISAAAQAFAVMFGSPGP